MSQNLYVTGYGNVTDRHPSIICQQEHTAHRPRLYNLVARIHFQDSCAHRKIQDIGMLKQCDSFTA